MCCEKHCAQDERTETPETPERRVLHDIGFFGHFIYTRRGGRGGKQHVLKTLYYADGQMTQRVLLEKTKTTSASLSEVVGKLESAGLVERERSEADRRQLVVRLTDEGREAGDLTVIEVADTGYWVLRFTDRFLDEESYGSADVRHILVKAELTQEDDPSTEDVDESTVPTQEALDASEAKAQEILDEYNAGDKTADSFGALAQQYSEDPGSAENGGLYEGITPSTSFLPAFIDWTFADGRESGDAGLVENDQEGQYGWHVMYLQDHTLTWKVTAENALMSDALNTWVEEIEGTYPVTTNETNLALLG